jgi:hypothetical protein
VTPGTYVLFYTSEESDAKLILFEKTNTLWMDANVVPTSIKVENSGLVIVCDECRFYVGKNNVTRINVNSDNLVTSIETISRAGTSAAIKTVTNDEVKEQAPVDNIKLYVKRISPRLYNKVKDMTTHAEMKTAVVEFMSDVHDLNHLIKLEKDLFYSLRF